ncbi:hypothetical protein JCM33374_g2262 [Metschnikowia sp. JCM 33374]|nr:hypothetical protein JCM33374_g2262 [Metschnikowia sp. JCM 33374]
MKFLVPATLFSTILATKVLHQGTLVLAPVDSDIAPKLLGISQDKVVADNSISYFGYHKKGALSFILANKYVSVNGKGELVLASSPQYGFYLADDPETIWTKQLSYKGNADFQLCPDSSIRIKNNCEGAQRVRITYERDWPIDD